MLIQSFFVCEIKKNILFVKNSKQQSLVACSLKLNSSVFSFIGFEEENLCDIHIFQHFKFLLLAPRNKYISIRLEPKYIVIDGKLYEILYNYQQAEVTQNYISAGLSKYRTKQ